jgi:hypothetical protein
VIHDHWISLKKGKPKAPNSKEEEQSSYQEEDT